MNNRFSTHQISRTSYQTCKNILTFNAFFNSEADFINIKSKGLLSIFI